MKNTFDIDLSGAQFSESIKSLGGTFSKLFRGHDDAESMYQTHVGVLLRLGVTSNVIPPTTLEIVSFCDEDYWFAIEDGIISSFIREGVLPHIDFNGILGFTPMEVVDYMISSGKLDCRNGINSTFLENLYSSDVSDGLCASLMRKSFTDGEFEVDRNTNKRRKKMRQLRVYDGMMLEGIDSVKLFDVAMHYIVTGESYTIDEIEEPYQSQSKKHIETPFLTIEDAGKYENSWTPKKLNKRWFTITFNEKDDIERANKILSRNKSVIIPKDHLKPEKPWSPPEFFW